MDPSNKRETQGQASQTVIQQISSWLSPLRNLISIGSSSFTPISRLSAHSPALILITGLDEAGKSTLLRRYLSPRPDSIIQKHNRGPGIHIEELQAGQAVFQAYDICGCRPSWHMRFDEGLFRRADAVVYVVDAADRDRVMEARHELMMFGLRPNNGGMRDGVPLLILATKGELKGARRPDQLETFFIDNISTSIGKRSTHVAGANLLTGEGVLEAFSWLSNALSVELSLQHSENHEKGGTDEKPNSLS